MVYGTRSHSTDAGFCHECGIETTVGTLDAHDGNCAACATVLEQEAEPTMPVNEALPIPSCDEMLALEFGYTCLEKGHNWEMTQFLFVQVKQGKLVKVPHA